MDSIRINKINDVLIIKRNLDSGMFITTNDSIIIPIFELSALLKFLLIREFVSPKVLEGVLDEYYNIGK